VKRIVEPEILDDLDPADPDAVRSRRDLRMINSLMGGQAWVVKQVCGLQDVQRIVELGAGDGKLCRKMKSRLPDCEVVAVDLIAKPDGVRDDVTWQTSNVLEYDEFDSDTVVVANLFMHHLEDHELHVLAARLKEVHAVVFAEPHRKISALCLGRCLFPLVNHVTRHDMIASIKAGFTRGEMAGAFGSNFRCHEKVGLLGGIRMMGVRK
jgi:2-polyprenyl-3-methyl-5-hydroxy-6-metoxy-1,4-benzoquinol methylase